MRRSRGRMELQAAKSHRRQRPRRHEPDGLCRASLASPVYQHPVADRTATVVVSFDENVAKACIRPGHVADGERGTCALYPPFTLRRQVVSRGALVQVKPPQNLDVTRSLLDCGEITLVDRAEGDEAVRKRRVRRYEPHDVETPRRLTISTVSALARRATLPRPARGVPRASALGPAPGTGRASPGAGRRRSAERCACGGVEPSCRAGCSSA